MTQWQTTYDSWLACVDGAYVRWSAVEEIYAAPAHKEGWDVIAHLQRRRAIIGHYDTKDAAQDALKELLGRLSDHYCND